MYNIISQVFICMLGGDTVCQIMEENGAKKKYHHTLKIAWFAEKLLQRLYKKSMFLQFLSPIFKQTLFVFLFQKKNLLDFFLKISSAV